jgi:Subtilase family
MSWQSIAHGAHVNWAQPNPLSGTDPYLVWADGSGFACYGGLQRSGKIATLIELIPGKTVADLVANSGSGLQLADIPGAYRLNCRFLTAWPSAAFFQHLKTTLAHVVARAEISIPVMPQRPKFNAPGAPRCGPKVARTIQRKTLIGVIDDGCAFAHYQLRDSAGRTRVCRIWDQDDHGAFSKQGQVPPDFGRGHEVTGAQLQSLIASMTQHGAVDEDATYAAAIYDRLKRATTHGAHITDVTAGSMPVGSRVGSATRPPTWAQANDIAASDDAGLVFVQLPRACLQDPSGAWLDVHVLDALRYIMSCADEHTEQVIINLSFGPQRGPNNGSGMLEKAFDELSAEFPHLTLTLAAGNSFLERGHASLKLKAKDSKTLHWQIMPGDETPTFVQLWMPDGAKHVEVRVTPPGVVSSPWIKPGDAQVWPDAANPSCGIIYPVETSRGKSGALALVALAPSESFNPATALVPHGLWTIEIRNTAAAALAKPVQAWIDRDDFNLGTMVRGRQSYFADPLYDPLRYLKAATDDIAGSKALVKRRGTLTGIATGSGALVAAGYRHSDKKHVDYSSAGPTRGAASGPTCAAVTDQSRSLPGVLAAGTRGGSVVRLIGTSTGAPQLARWVTNGKTSPGPSPGPQADPQLEGAGLLPL